MIAFALAWLQAHGLEIILGAVTAAAKEYLRRKALADAGAASQRAADAAAAAAQAAIAGKIADDVHSESDADFGRDAGGWGLVGLQQP